MRMWNTKTSEMCNRHLLGEHVEMHMFVGTLNKEKSINGYLNKGLVEVHKIKKRHEELVNEMERRGFNHKSILPEYRYKKVGSVNVRENKKELARRCKNCKKMQKR
jgi:hypothetical protein